MIGYSLGEYVCACLLRSPLTTRRDSRSSQPAPSSSTSNRAVRCGPCAARRRTIIASLESDSDIALARSTRPAGVRAGGDESALANLATALSHREIACQRIASSHPLHTDRLAAAATDLRDHARTLRLNRPAIPYVSNLTGTLDHRQRSHRPRLLGSSR